MFLNTLVWSCIGLYSHAVCAYDIGETQEVPRTCFFMTYCFTCASYHIISYKNNAFSVEHLRCTVPNAEKYWHCNLGVFTDDAPVCKVFTVDLYLILLFCLTCNHLTKLSENNSVIILCPTVLGAQLQFCPQTKPVHVSAPLFSLIGTRSVARTILKHRATEFNLEHHLMMPQW